MLMVDGSIYYLSLKSADLVDFPGAREYAESAHFAAKLSWVRLCRKRSF